MSKEIDIQLVKDHYARIGNEELIHIATKDAAGMTPEAQEVIKAELRSRNLDSSFIKGVEAQNREHSLADISTYCEILRALDCPKCGSTGYKLNATLTNQVMSFIILTQRSKKIVIACPDCLDRANNNALLTTVAMGWWGIPWGPIRSIMAIADNISYKKSNRIDQPTPLMMQVAASAAGQIETYKEDKAKLQALISSM